MKLKLAVLPLLYFSFVGFGISNEQFTFWGDLQPGPYPVGFQVQEKYDYSRTYRPKYDYEGNLLPGERARPIQINIWYPASSKVVVQTQPFEEFIVLTANEDQPGKPSEKARTEAVKKFFETHWKDASEDEINRLLKSKTASILNAESDSGSHPLIIFAQSQNLPSPWSHSILCEYLASHGYIVVSSPALGDKQKQLDRKDPITQLNDIQFLLLEMRNFTGVDRNKLAVIGYGLGGLTGTILAMNNYDVDALVSLDGMMATKHGYSLLFQHPLFKPARFYSSMLHISGAEQSDQSDDSFFNSAKYSNIYQLKFKGLRTADYSSIGMISVYFPNFGGQTKTESNVRKKTYESICTYVHHFLNAYVMKNPESMSFLKRTPEELGLSAELAQLELKQGLKRPPSEQEFVKILKEKGIDDAKQIYQEVTKNDPEYRLFSPDSLNTAAKGLLQNKKTKEAIEVLNINLQAYPDDWRILDALGNAHAVAGEKSIAIDYLGKSLEMNPENNNAIETLKKLKESQ